MNNARNRSDAFSVALFTRGGNPVDVPGQPFAVWFRLQNKKLSKKAAEYIRDAVLRGLVPVTGGPAAQSAEHDAMIRMLYDVD